MNLRKNMRRGSLAALITLALTSSALAMPTGGVVQSGDVNIGGSTDFLTVADGATITAGTDSTINWNTFNIGSGETLNFNIADGKTLVNNVTGSQLSNILGKMNQPGGGGYGGYVVLVNPNGIMFALPFVFILLGTILYRAKVTLTEAEHARIVEELEEKWDEMNK